MNFKYRFLRLFGYKTYDEMYKELKDGRRELISPRDIQKSSLFPRGIRYPKTSDIYLCIEDAPISYLTHWMKPYTGGGKAIFPKNERIKIAEIKQPKPTSVYCQAINTDKIEALLVSQSERQQVDYNGYSLEVNTITLHEKFRLIESIN